MGDDISGPNPKSVGDAQRSRSPWSSYAQGSSAQQKASHRHGQNCHNRNGSKHNPNGGHPLPFPVHHVPIYQPVLPHMFPPMVPSPVAIPGYGFQPCPPPFPGAENQISKVGTENPRQGLASPGHDIDSNRNIQPPSGDPNVTGATTSSRRPNVPEGVTRPYPMWHYPRAFGPRDGMMQPAMVRAYAYPSFFRPAPPFVGLNFPGASPIYYVPPAPPGSIRAMYPPRFAPHPMSPILSPEALELRDSILKQIEYYFSDANLKTDNYLITQMDDQGWVPITVIAEFKRVKRMSSDIRFILDVLQSSETVEVQADKVRKRDNWSKYIIGVERESPVAAQTSMEQITGIIISNVETDMRDEVRKEVATETAVICTSNSDHPDEVSTNDGKLEGTDSSGACTSGEKAVNDSDKPVLLSEQISTNEKFNALLSQQLLL